ncbi:hypothetical protein L9F63_006226, partial [Diploptera punctata]
FSFFSKSQDSELRVRWLAKPKRMLLFIGGRGTVILNKNVYELFYVFALQLSTSSTIIN